MIEYNLNFMHPQYGTTLNVDIDATFTIDEMINNLLLSGFIGENKAGYDLALKEYVLDRTATFAEIEELYDGAVIRIIAHQENQVVQKTKPNSLKFHLKHPKETLILDVYILESATLSELIQDATDKNFVQGNHTILNLQKGDKLLDLNKTAEENSVKSGDFLQIIDTTSANTPNPTEAAVVQLNNKIQELESNIKTEFDNIKNALPAANMIPIDPTRAVNPTMETYESIDTIVNRLRQTSNQTPLTPIRPFPINLVVTLTFISLLMLLVLLKFFQII